MKPHFKQPVESRGEALEASKGVMILIHGRGASPASILSLVPEFNEPELSYMAPAAANNTWYPFSFLAPIEQNEPGISSGIFTIAKLVDELVQKGIPLEKIIIGGFSQGACLSAEFLARNPGRYGGGLFFSGGIIGPKDLPRDYSGSLNRTPVFLGCSDVDAHVPLWRVEETADVLSQLGADVDKRIYPGMAHTIVEDEIDAAKQIIAQLGK